MRAFTRRDTLTILAASATAAAAISSAHAQGNVITMPDGLKIIDVKAGTGASPKTGQTCVMHYTGWLYENGAKGKKFDSSVDRGEPFEFPIGAGQRDQGLGRRRRHHEGRRQAHADHSARARLRRARRRRRHSAERDADVRRRAARGQIALLIFAGVRLGALRAKAAETARAVMRLLRARAAALAIVAIGFAAAGANRHVHHVADLRRYGAFAFGNGIAATAGVQFAEQPRIAAGPTCATARLAKSDSAG